MSDRTVCIHGHFYQPPRENPWLEEVELQDSAAPYHDWNDRITAECYEPNTAARILDSRGRIQRIVSNYARISFNFGPTLLSWLQRHQRGTYEAILEADRLSRQRFSGHGSALAQAYNHLIMPLASRRDKQTQIRWGMVDFRHRFGRDPEGMWLPETAVDLESLELLAEAGIRFTLLAPHQAARVRRIGEERWQEVPSAGIDPRRAYLCPLPSGKSIALFFYDGPMAQEVAFGDLLRSGHALSARLLGTLGEGSEPQLAHVATDGETYGHHHRFGEMALAYCLDQIEGDRKASLTIYGEYLERFPPAQEVEIREKTSWSCAHGVERWRSDCGCRIGGSRGGSQAWRAPLRETLDWLRDRLLPLYEKSMAPLLADPWKARDEYIEVILDRSPAKVEKFLRRQAGRELSPEESVRALRLLEMQRQALLMYTSCGWFFDDVSGIETVQVLGYASRALQLADEAAGVSLEAEFLTRLERAKSNFPKWTDGARVYRELVTPMRLDLPRVAAHHAIASEFAAGTHRDQMYCYRAENLYYEQVPAGRLKLSLGRVRVHSEVTWNEGDFSFAVLHLGGHHVTAGVRAFAGEEVFAAMSKEVRGAFERSDIPGVIRLLDRHFGEQIFSLWHLFKDEQRKILEQLMARSLEEIESLFEGVYQDHYPLLRFLREIRMPVPRTLALPVEQVVHSRMRRLLEDRSLHPVRLREVAEEVERLDIALERPLLGFLAGRQLSGQIEKLLKAPENLALLMTVNETLVTLTRLDLRPNLWRAQNLYCSLATKLRERGGCEGECRAEYGRLGDLLGVEMA